MGWEHSSRRSRLPGNWKSIREKVFRLKGRKCYVVYAGEPCHREATDIDHVVAGDNHDIDNLQPICRFHHALKSSREGNEAFRKMKRASRMRVEREFSNREVRPVPHEPFKHPWMEG